MESIRKYYKIAANSILESVIALSVISACLYISIIVYASVFSPKTTAKFYATRNKLDEMYFLMQVKNDSITSIENDNLKLVEEIFNANLKKVTIKYKDSTKNNFENYYYINHNE